MFSTLAQRLSEARSRCSREKLDVSREHDVLHV